jgi:hypothetical protein
MCFGEVAPEGKKKTVPQQYYDKDKKGNWN